MKLNNQSFCYLFSMTPYEMSVPPRLTILIQNRVYVRLLYLMCLYAHVSVHTCMYTDAHAQRLEEDFGWPVDCSLTFCLHLLC